MDPAVDHGCIASSDGLWSNLDYRMNDQFLSILVAKIDVWISISIFWLPKCPPYIGLTEKVHWRRAVHCHSRQPSIQVTGVWWEWRLFRLLKPTPFYLQQRHLRRRHTSWTPAVRCAGDLRQTTPLPVPARHSNACQWLTDVCQHELSVYGILVNTQLSTTD